MFARFYVFSVVLTTGWCCLTTGWLAVCSKFVAGPERRMVFDQVVKQLSPNSVIEIGENEHKWSEGAGSYAYHMSRSR